MRECDSIRSRCKEQQSSKPKAMAVFEWRKREAKDRLSRSMNEKERASNAGTIYHGDSIPLYNLGFGGLAFDSQRLTWV